MKTSIKLAMAFAAVAAAVGTGAVAAEQRQGGNRMAQRLERADTDNSGDVSFEEFKAAMDKRLGNADADHDGKITVAELAAEIERMRAERMAQRIIRRFDTNGDGVLTAAEVEGRQKKIFALLDRNDDGKIEQSEMPRRFGRHWRQQ